MADSHSALERRWGAIRAGDFPNLLILGGLQVQVPQSPSILMTHSFICRDMTVLLPEYLGLWTYVSGLGRGQASEGWDSESCTQRQTGEGTMIENGPVG